MSSSNKAIFYILRIITTITLSFIFCISAEKLSAQSRPNIILILADDVRYDSFHQYGGPSWFKSPSLDRIAEEGATFDNYFCVYSLCIPSRSSIMTGLYPHSNGAYDNYKQYNSSLPTIATILDSAGYNTAMVGKYHVYKVSQPGWDYWMAKIGETDYIDPEFNVNGDIKTISGNTTKIINDTAAYLVSVLDTPFFLCIMHQAAHQPVTPLPEHDGIYSTDTMPIPSNFSHYTTDYPSFLYDDGYYEDTAKIVDHIEAYYEGLQGIESNVNEIFNILTARNILKKTCILFTADNGYLEGEHGLIGKGLPYEESIRLPLLICYRPWFQSKITVKALSLHVDIAPTLLEVAGINQSPYEFQGYSLHKLATGQVHRDYIMYENIKLAYDTASTPSIRTLRSSSLKYNRYQCADETEEFFNLKIDPHENINLIDDPDYADVIDSFRQILDSIRVSLHDTLSLDTLIKDCHLVKPRGSTVVHIIPDPQIFLKASPNPFSQRLDISVVTKSEETIDITIYNRLGQLVFQQALKSSGATLSTSFDTSDLPDGIYLVRVQDQTGVKCEHLLKNGW